ncbi:glutathione S-transferase family protein [bacterium]|nr:glutathione S-transferase family protein [bacterium]
MKLYSLPPSPNSFKIAALAHHLGLPLEVVPVDMLNGQHQSPEYLALNPNGLMPTLQDGDFTLWESNAILIYLAQKKPESGLYPQDPKGQALVHQWLDWYHCHWGTAFRPYLVERLFKPQFRGQPGDEQVVAQAEEPFRKVAAVLNSHLSQRPYLLGEALTVADFAVASVMVFANAVQVPLADYPHIRAYADRVLKLPAFAQAIPPMGTPAGKS